MVLLDRALTLTPTFYLALWSRSKVGVKVKARSRSTICPPSYLIYLNRYYINGEQKVQPDRGSKVCHFC